MPTYDRFEETLKTFKIKLRKAKSIRGSVSNDRKKFYVDAIDDAARLDLSRFGELGSNLGHFTAHGPDHSTNVMEHVLSIKSSLENMKNALSIEELFVLGLAVYLHDLGMTAPLPNDILRKCKTEDDKWIEKRKRHADAIEYIINSEKEKSLAFLNQTEWVSFDKVIISVCKAHSAKNLSKSIEFFKSYARLAPGIRFAMLAGLLLLADEMDLSRERARIDFPLYDEFNDVTKAHWWKHWLIQKCYLDQIVFRIVHVPQSINPSSEIFQEWTYKKLESQLELLRNELDPTSTSFFSHLEIKIEHSSDNIDTIQLPRLDDSIIAIAKRETLKYAPGPQDISINDPIRLITRTGNKQDEHVNPSEAYIKIIAPHADLFREQGANVTEDSLVGTYVWIEKNRVLMEHLLELLSSHLRMHIQPPNKAKGGEPHRDSDGGIIRQSKNHVAVTGEIGVGKTHFLGMLLAEFKKKYPSLYQKTLLIRCETTDCATMLEVKREVVKSLLLELDRLGCASILRNATEAGKLKVYIPLYPEIVALTGDEIDQFITTMGLLVSGPDGKQLLGDKAPTAICIFFDNSDRLPEHILSDTYDWGYTLGLNGIAATMLFFRPITFDREMARKQTLFDDRSIRNPNTVYSPPQEDILLRRIAYLLESYAIGKTSPFSLRMETSPASKVTITSKEVNNEEVRNMLEQICVNMVESGKGLLPNLVGTNARYLLQTFLRVLSSWKMDNETYLRSAFPDRTQGEERPITGWPRMFEALMLGHRRWYDPKFSPIENLFHPPVIESYGDYFIAIHLLQMIEHFNSRESTANSKGLTLRDLHQIALRMGYSIPRVDLVLQWLCKFDDADEQSGRICSLLQGVLSNGVVVSSSQGPFDTDTRLNITSWGNYHLHVAIFQLRYWKHILYDLVIPREISNSIIGDQTSLVEDCLFHNFEVLHDFFLEREKDWFLRKPNAGEFGIKPIMRRIIKEINFQKKSAR